MVIHQKILSGLGFGDDEGGGEEDEKDPNPQRFLPQCFLMDFYKKFAGMNESYSYRNLCKINGNSTFSMNKLLDRKDAFSINDLTPHQQSLLIPSFSLTKIYEDDSEKEFLFDDYTDISTITRTNQDNTLRLDGRGKPNAVGFVSFSWDDEGSNPANTGMIFKASLKLVAADIASLFFVPSPNHPPFSELLQQDATPKKAKLNPKFDAKASTIRVDVGWKLSPSLLNGELFPGVDLDSMQNAIMNSRITLFLSLMTHDLSIKENGGIEITIEYKARTDSVLSSPASNILYLGKQSEAEIENSKNNLKTIAADLEKAKTNLNTLEDARYNDIQDNQRDIFGDKYPDWEIALMRKFGTRDTVEIDKAEVKIEDLEKDLEETKKANAKLLQDKKYDTYSALLSEIIRQKRLFFVTLTDKQLELLKRLTAIYTDPNLDADQILKARAEIVKGFSMIQGTTMSPPARVASNRNPGHELRTAVTKPHDEGFWGQLFSGGSDNESAIKELGKGIEKETKQAKRLKDGRINFIFLGDILNAAFRTVQQSQKDDGDKRIVNYAVGSIDILDFEMKKFVPINLADIPISYEYFNSWFQKKVVVPQTENWNVRAFIRDVVSELVVNALSPTCFGKTMAEVRLSVNSAIIDLPYGPEGQLLPRGRIHLSPSEAIRGASLISKGAYQSAIYRNLNELPKVSLSKGWKKSSEFSHHLYMYASGFSSADLKGNYQEDRKDKGILHLLIGSDRGLLKSVSFKRVDQPGQAEKNMAKAAKGGAIANQLFSNRYNVDLTLFGNTLFKPGMMIYLDTTVLGIGKPNDEGSAAAKMGLGGYFRVVKCGNVLDSGKFETQLQCILECYGDDKGPKQAGTPPSNISDPTKSKSAVPDIGSMIKDKLPI